MSNQVVMWSILIVPWATLLLFMKKEDIKRYMPAALFNMVTNILIVDIGITLNIWVTQ